MPSDDNVVVITRSDAMAHRRQAEEYLRAAEHSLAIGDFNAAAGTAIDAVTNAADAVAGVDGRDIAKELRGLLPIKTQAHYSAQSVTAAKASMCVAAARRAVAVAERVTERSTN